MADYASIVTLDFPAAKKIGSALYMLSGKVNVTNYNQALAEITGITRKLRRVYNVICDGISANGFVPRWDRTAKSIKCFYPTKAITPAGANAAEATHTHTENTAATYTQNATTGAGSSHNHAFTGTAVAAQAGTEVVNDVAVGEINFVAYGYK